MKSNEKKLILVLILLVIIVVIVKVKKSGNKTEVVENTVKEEFVQVLEDGTKLNTSSALNQDKMVGNLSFKNIQLTNQNGQSVLLADVTNTGSTTSEMMLVDIIILDKTGAELGKVGGIVSKLEAGESTQFNTSMTMDYANAYDFKVVEK